MLRPFLLAVQFLTRIPVSGALRAKAGELGSSLLFYPVVGALIGLALISTAWLSQAAGAVLSAVLVLAVWVILTGGLHLDGLADTIDGWVGGAGSKERTLEIMQDPAAGPMGVLGLLLLILLKTAAVYTLLANSASYYLPLAPILGRTLAILLFARTPYIRVGGLGERLAKELPREKVYTVALVVAASFFITMKMLGLYLLLCCAAIFYTARHCLLKRLGGFTGDTAGALIEISETVVLLTIVFCL